MAAAAPGWFALALLLSAVAGYLLGSVNFALVVCYSLYGKDVRTMGSGNAGMTNVLRSFGRWGAALTMAGDTLKGILTVFCGRWLMLLLVPGMDGLFGNTLYGAYVAGIAAILGHAFPLYFGFKGGKGIATALGVILSLQPVVAMALLAVFLVVLAISKMVSLGSVIGISCYPLFTLLWCLFVSGKGVAFSTVCAAFIAAFIVWLHRENLKRIATGTENRIGAKKRTVQDEVEAEQEGEQVGG